LHHRYHRADTRRYKLGIKRRKRQPPHTSV
jgi:hypothetical protein